MDCIWSLFYCDLTNKVTLRCKSCAARNLICHLLLGLFIIIWVIHNGGHIVSDKNMIDSVALKIKEGFVTNYSGNEFNETYVKEYERQNYNRPWDPPDYVTIFGHEIHVTTNMAITANQSKSKCPEHPALKGVLCETDDDCEPGKKRNHGTQTGRCVSADFPYQNLTTYKWAHNISTCEIEGWCPVDRILPPLNNYSAVLIETKNTTLWITNTVVFPDYGITLSNLGDLDLTYMLEHRYHPHSDPHCPVFVLGDIIAFTPNAGDTYEEMAKFGADILIAINWNCYSGVYAFIKGQHFNKCLPEYSFKRIDNEQSMPANGYIYNYNAYYYNGGESRTLFRSYSIRFKAEASGAIHSYDFYKFVTSVSAYSWVLGLSYVILNIYIKKRHSDLINQIHRTIDAEEDEPNRDNELTLLLTDGIKH